MCRNCNSAHVQVPAQLIFCLIDLLYVSICAESACMMTGREMEHVINDSLLNFINHHRSYVFKINLTLQQFQLITQRVFR